MRISIFLILVVISSCKGDKETTLTDQKETYTLIETGVKKFSLDERHLYRAIFVNTYTDSTGKELLVLLNHNEPSIHLYDIKSQALLKEIKLEIEANGVGSAEGLLMLTPDSIFVISSSQYRVSLINQKSELLKTYRVLDGKYNENTGMLQPFTTSPPVKVGSKLYFNVAPDRDVYSPSYYDGHINLVLDLKTGEYSYFNNYPKAFRDAVWGVAGINFSTCYNPKTHLFTYSFTVLDSLVTYDPSLNVRKSYYAASRFIKEKIRPMVKPDNEHDLEYALETPYYGALLYDQYQNLYYRFVDHNIPYKDEASGEINDFHEKPISIIILNENFEIVGEKMLAKNTYLHHIYFLTSDGLFISNGNPANPELNEDHAVYTCFKVQQL